MDVKSYRVFNLIMAGILGIVFLYAGFFTYDTHSVKCVYKAATGLDCPTCGLTRAFHAFLTGHWRQAMDWNRFAALIFLFFSLQFIARVFLFSYPYFYRPLPSAMPKWDGIISLLLFLACFAQLILFQL